MKYHARIGFTYMPNAKLRISGAGGGYLVRTNAAGFRSDREFQAERRPGTFRALLFGDSQTAGDGVINALRYSDLLEKAVPGLEVCNYGVSGTGPDQHFLIYQENAAIEHDLVVIGLYVENIRRVNSRFIKSRDANGSESILPKPYFQIENQELALHHVPVPKQPWTEQSLPPELQPYVYSFHDTDFFNRISAAGSGQSIAISPLRKSIVNLALRLRKFQPAMLAPLRRFLRKVTMRISGFTPVPDYNSPVNPGWLLLSKILQTWAAASRTPILLIPIPDDTFRSGLCNPRAYQARFNELAQQIGCHLYDPLPELLKLSGEERRAMSDSTGHLTARGHETMARLLTPVIESLACARKPVDVNRSISTLRRKVS